MRELLQHDIFCLHVEHGLRPANESCGDADFVRDFCQTKGIECRVEHIPPGKIASYAKRKGIGIAASARYFRHKSLYKEAARLGENTLILLAHTKDDLLETVLMRILRGSGSAGLSAMPIRRGRIFRPMISVTRAEIIDYLTAKNISWREDSTNSDTKYLRNRIRHKLVPLLNESFPSWNTGVEAMAQTQAMTADFIAKEAETRIKWEVNPEISHRDTEAQRTQSKKEGLIYTDEENFFKQPVIIREEAIYQGLNSLFSLRALRALRRTFGSRSAPPRENFLNKSIKRSVIRRFCEGTVNAADLGSARLKRENGQILLSLANKEFFECGVSRLIK